MFYVKFQTKTNGEESSSLVRIGEESSIFEEFSLRLLKENSSCFTPTEIMEMMKPMLETLIKKSNMTIDDSKVSERRIDLEKKRGDVMCKEVCGSVRNRKIPRFETMLRRMKFV